MIIIIGGTYAPVVERHAQNIDHSHIKSQVWNFFMFNSIALRDQCYVVAMPSIQWPPPDAQTCNLFARSNEISLNFMKKTMRDGIQWNNHKLIWHFNEAATQGGRTRKHRRLTSK